MLQILFYGLLAFFLMLYVLRALLMTGYDQLNISSSEERKRFSFFKCWMLKLLLLKPLSQSKLTPRSIDHKVHIRFQQKAGFYYYSLWACMFVILLLAAKIYLGLFS